MLSIIAINGAPRSGKDSLATNIVLETRVQSGSRLNAAVYAAAQPIDDALDAFFDDFLNEPFAMLTLQREVKDSPCIKVDPALNDVSPRQLRIGFAESFVKPILGKKTFGILLAHRILTSAPVNGIAVISDTGFQAEFDAVCEVIKAQRPDTKIHLVHLTREGCNYNNDSREPVKPNEHCDMYHRHENNGSLNDLSAYAARVVKLAIA